MFICPDIQTYLYENTRVYMHARGWVWSVSALSKQHELTS